MIFLGLQRTVAQPTSLALKQAIWDGLGGKAQWDNTRYLMFSCTGPHRLLGSGVRTYIYDKEIDKCRLEATTNTGQRLVAIVDIAKKDGKVYLEGNETEATEAAELLAEIQSLFYKDAGPLFFPILLTDAGVDIRFVEEKFIDSSRYTLAAVQSKNISPKATFNGLLLIDHINGRPFQWLPNELPNTFKNPLSFEQYKDIGSGIVMATKFKSDTGEIYYPIVAGLVHIEAEKFSKP